MSRRIYWLLPDLVSARQTMNDLLLARITERAIHFAGAENTELTGLHAANLLQTSDLIRSAQMGLVLGGAVGACAGLVGALFPIVGTAPEWTLVAVLAVVGGVFGAWAASLIGISVPSRRLARFAEAIGRGQILLMIDVPRSRVEEIESMLRVHHPEARYQGLETQIPAFP